MYYVVQSRLQRRFDEEKQNWAKSSLGPFERCCRNQPRNFHCFRLHLIQEIAWGFPKASLGAREVRRHLGHFQGCSSWAS